MTITFNSVSRKTENYLYVSRDQALDQKIRYCLRHSKLSFHAADESSKSGPKESNDTHTPESASPAHALDGASNW